MDFRAGGGSVGRMFACKHEVLGLIPSIAKTSCTPGILGLGGGGRQEGQEFKVKRFDYTVIAFSF